MRPFQLVVWGGSGFTGRLVCEHIAHDYQGKFRWAIAGRSQAKLDALKADLVSINPACKDVPLLIADSSNQTAVDDVASKTDVLLTTAGPFAKIGLPVVKACANHGTHYCDITGEAHFVRQSIRECDAKAKETGAKLLHSCGYDSIPADLSTLEVVNFARHKFGRPPDEVTVLEQMKGTVSGGTIDSALGMLKESTATLKEVSDPYCLDPPGSKNEGGKGADGPIPIAPLWSDAAQCWTGPFIMASANEPVVRRTNALLNYVYGERFRFRERTPASGYVGALLSSAGLGAVVAGVFAAAKLPFVRKMLPAAGEGPSKAVQTSSFWKASCYGLLKGQDGAAPKRVLAVLGDPKRDPGYWSTSRMILETALCLVLEQDALAKDEYASQVPAGVLTPAAALGLVLTQRLVAAGYTFEVKEL